MADDTVLAQDLATLQEVSEEIRAEGAGRKRKRAKMEAVHFDENASEHEDGAQEEWCWACQEGLINPTSTSSSP